MSDVQGDGSNGTGWNGVDRRKPVSNDETIDKIHTAILASAEATTKLADALTDSVLRQGKGIRNWLIGLSLAFLVIGGVVVWGRVEGSRTGARTATLVDCLAEDGECFARLRENERVVTDADRKLLAQEIMCFAFQLCPPGMTPDNIPDLEGLVLVPDDPEVPATGTTTTIPE